MILAPLALWPQSSAPSSIITQESSSYGNAEQPQLSYGGAPRSRNLLLLSLASENAYDDNVLNSNIVRRGELTFAFGPRIAYLQQRRRLSFGLNYQPYFRVYQRTEAFNDLNHAVGLDMSYDLGPRFTLRLRDSFGYTTGIFRPRSNQEFIRALGSPASLNQTVFTPLARQQENIARLDATYRRSARTSFTLFGGFQRRDFKGEASSGQGLFNTRGLSGGLEYRYRLSAHSTLGMAYLVQNLRFGNEGRVLTHGPFASLAWRLSPAVELEVFAGPQYTRLHDRSTFSLPFLGSNFTPTTGISQTEWNWAAGGTMTKRTDKTVLRFSAQRTVTDGGGLLTSVTSSIVDMGLRRRLTRRWDAVWDLNGARTDALNLRFAGSSVNSWSAAFGLERALSESLTARLAYNMIQQRTRRRAPLFPTFDRNWISFGVAYQFKRIPVRP